MKKAFSIFRRELAAYFYSPMAYIIISVFLLLTGWFFTSELFLAETSSLRSVFNNIIFIFIFFIPAITMRLVSEERKSGTIELLVTMPVSDIEIILGKFFAGLALIFVAILFTIPYALTLMFLGEPDIGMLITGYFGLILLGAGYASIGIFASTITRNQVVAFIISFVIIFALFMVGSFLTILPVSIVPILQFLSIDYHFENIARGVLDSRDILYYLSLIVFMLALSKLSLESRKWN